MNLHVSLAAEPIFHIGFVSITNSMLSTLFVTTAIILFTFLISKNEKIKDFTELVIESLLDFFHGIVGENARKFFPLVATFFIFIFLSNLSGLFPGVGSIGFKVYEDGKEHFIPLLRAPTADLNNTLALAIISVLAIHYFSLKHLGTSKYIVNHFINPVGILELISDIAKILSFTFRLFGNIFAGEVLLIVIGSLMPLIAPLPFIGLEIFVGFIQALVFSLLTIIFLNTAVEV